MDLQIILVKKIAKAFLNCVLMMLLMRNARTINAIISWIQINVQLMLSGKLASIRVIALRTHAQMHLRVIKLMTNVKVS